MFMFKYGTSAPYTNTHVLQSWCRYDAASQQHQTDRYWAFTRYDRRTDRSVRLVGPTGRSDDRIV